MREDDGEREAGRETAGAIRCRQTSTSFRAWLALARAGWHKLDWSTPLAPAGKQASNSSEHKHKLREVRSVAKVRLGGHPGSGGAVISLA